MYTYLTLFFYVITQINCLIEQQPIFTSQPVDVGPLFSGTRGILQCTASGTPTVQYKWLKNGSPLTNKSSSNGGVYLIGQADRAKDVGFYQCIAENRLGSVLSNKAFLTVAYMDQLKVSYPTEIRVKAGRAAIIKLPKIYEAYPAPTIEWFAGGALIEPNAKFAITKDFNLVVLRCDKADEKSYYVEVSSIHTGARIRSREIRLYVTENSFIDQDFDGFNDDEFSDSNYASSKDSIDLEFVIKPTDSIAKLNDNLVKFDCIVNSRKQALDQLEINWYKDNLLIDFIKTKYHLSSRSLEIISVTDQDAGVYTCSAKYNVLSNQENNIVSINASAKLDVYIKPTFKNQPESLIETDFGKTVQLRCDGISNPQANITWYKNAEPIDFEKQSNIQQVDSGTRLIISDISLKDQGIYQCFLSNDAGHISASTLIKIISFAPKFSENIKNQTVYSDSNIELSCGRVDGSPKPKIVWTKIDSFSEQLEFNEHHDENDFQDSSYSNNQNRNGDLTIRNVNLKHQGWYKCEASNILGKVSASMYLQVKKKTEIIEPPMNISVTKGQSALFKCKVSKEDDIEIDFKWKFNDQILDLVPWSSDYDPYYQDSQYSNLRLYKNGTLQIIEAKNTDIGTYKCIVNSLNNIEAGNDSKTAYLNVVELPYAPFNLNANLNPTEKRSVNLTWQSSFDGNSPILKYIIHAKINSFDQTLTQYEQTNDWFVIKDNVIVTQYYFYNNQQQVYWTLIYDLKPAYIYEFRVSAVNGIGEGMPSRPSNNITIPEEVPSQPPQNIQAYSINSRTINLQWQSPLVTSWNGRLKGYQIAYSLSYPNSSWKYVQIDDTNTNTINLTDLIVWETYLIKMCAFNSKGYGRQSHPPLRIRTKEGIPIRPPLNFKANSINSTCIQMNWNEPPAQFVNGLIQGYKLLFSENNQSDSKLERVILSNQSQTGKSGEFNYEMCNLSKFTLYTLSLLCFTSSGDGPLTQPIQLKTLEDVPGEVSEIEFNNVYDTSVDIEWRPPVQPNGRILSYIISYKPALNGSKFENIIVDNSQSNFTIRNLQSSTEYIIGIRAKTQAGEGVQKLLQIKSGVPPELPEPPKAIVLRSIGQTSVELEFIPGFNGKTSINKWIVEALQVFNSKYSSKWVQVFEKSNAPNATKLVVSNLKPFTNYTLRMFSKNVKGISKPSQSTEIFQTLPDVPSHTPQYLSARLEDLFINSTLDLNVMVKWSPIPTSKWNGVPLGYVLFVTECLSNLTNKIEIKFNKFKQTSYMLKNLGAYKCYEIGISAWNSVGLGPKTSQDSLLIINRTSQCRPSNYTYNVNLYTVNSSAIKISWSGLGKIYWNGVLTGYSIRYQPVELPGHNLSTPIDFYDYDESDESQDNDLNFLSNYKSKDVFYRVSHLDENSQFFETILSGLLSYTTYKIEISACTRAGCGPSSLPVSIKTLEYLPSRPIDLNFPYVNLTNVKLEFKPPKYSNGILNSFRIRYSLKRLSNIWTPIYVTWNKNQKIYTVEINGLQKMEYYIFEISANNSWGFGDTARTIVYTIDNYSRLRPDRPSKPIVQKSSIKSNELTISWNTNSDNYSPIRFFTVQVSENSSEWRTVYVYKNSNSNLNNNFRLTIRGKDKQDKLIIKPNGYLYTFRIASTNDIGTSEFSEDSVPVKTKSDLPELNLHDLNVNVLNSNRIELEWLEQIDEEIKLNKFKIIYRLVQEEDPDSVMINEIVIDYKNTSKTQRIGPIEGVTNERLNFTSHKFVLTSQNFDKFGKYEIEICGLNIIGQSPTCLKSKRLVYIEDRYPLYEKTMLKTVKSLSSTEINVTWSRPRDEIINGNLYGYKILCINNEFLDTEKLVKYFQNEDLETILDEDFINVIIVEPELNSILLNNLKPYKNYTILIQVINQAGESNLPFKEINLFDNSIRAQTFESVPSSPANIMFGYVGYTFLNLTFFRPTEPNGEILAYELWYENVPTESSTTKIIRQEISTNQPNQTIHIQNLERMIYYKFKVRCKTRIDWGPYMERTVYTGPRLKKFYKSLEIGSDFREAPLAPSKPVYSILNETHSLLEWKSYSNDFDLFIIEVKFITPSLNQNESDFEFFSYSNTTSLYIDKFDKNLQNFVLKNQNLCLFRVFSFNRISISEPSPSSEFIHVNKLILSESQASRNFSNPNFYLNWWFLVIIALGSVTILIIVILIMLLRGKNKKFVDKKHQKDQMQQKMNTIKLMKMNQDNDSTDNLNSIYLAGSNQQLILTNSTNTLSRGTNNHVTLYEIRKSKRVNNGTLKTATYVSPNGTLSRVNIVDSSDLTDSNSATLLKQQQINGLNNPRILGNLLNLGPNNMAQPNDYCTSKVGALVLNENGTLKNNHYLMPLNNRNEETKDENDETKNQHLYFQHMGTNYGQNVNFNYSSSDNENEANFNHMSSNYMSKRQIYTTFGRQGPSNTSNLNNLPPPPPALLTSSVINTEQENLDDRRTSMNYQSTRNGNMYFDHQQVAEIKDQHKQIQSQPMYHYHQGPLIVDSSPPPAPPPPPMPPFNQGTNLRMSTKSPYIVKKPPVINPLPRIQPSVIKAAVSGNTEMLNSNLRTSQNLVENNYVTNGRSLGETNNLVSDPSTTNVNTSYNLSGDRVVMSNVAGSRRPVAGGYSFF